MDLFAKEADDIEVKTLATFFPMCHLQAEELNLLAQQITVFKGRKGKAIAEEGVTDNKAVFIISGTVLLENDKGEKQTLIAGSDTLRPISCAKPHKYTVTCQSLVTFFRVDNQVIENLLDVVQREEQSSTADVSQDLSNNPLFQKIYKDLLDNKLVIPSLPKVVASVQKALQGDFEPRKLEILLQSDPALASMLLKAANSVLYRSSKPVTTIEKAIIRLGIRTIKSLVTSYSMKGLYKSDSKLLNSRMKQLWKHSVEVAAVSFVLARKKSFDPELALLLGLLHDVGVLPILTYAEKEPELLNSPEELEQTIRQLHGELGGAILSKWNFSEDFIRVAKESDNWHRDHDGKADYCDVVLIAQLHSFIGKDSKAGLPALYKLPAFRKLGLDGDSGDKGIALLTDANEQILEARQLLSG